jgi:fumarate reductase flavoprotein subunit
MVQNKSLQADVIVCGGGLAGLSAAVTAQNGGLEVMVLEKRSSLGGTSNFVNGTYGIESPFQYARNIKTTKEEAFLEQMKYSHWQANAALVRAFIEKAATNIQWLQQMGVQFQHIMAIRPGFPQVWHIFKAEKVHAHGAAVINILAGQARKAGVQIYTGTAAKELLIDKAGRISGVVAEDKRSNTIRINSRAIIIATGGFSKDRKMLEKYTRYGNAEHSFDPNMTGDGIKMAWAVGAASEGLGTILGGFKMKGANFGIVTNLKIALQSIHGSYLWVNKLGERFGSEDLMHHEALNALINQPEGIMYIIFDETTKNKIIGKQEVAANRPEVSLYQLKRMEIDAEIKKGVEDGNIYFADTLPELGDKIGAEANIFLKTLAEYNRCCQQHYDDVFFKNPKYLLPVVTPKFYAAKACAEILTTLGGIKINHKTEVIGKNYRVIPGLYAGGICAGGLYGDTYDLQYTTGGASAFAIGTGRIAGENALEYITKDST